MSMHESLRMATSVTVIIWCGFLAIPSFASASTKSRTERFLWDFVRLNPLMRLGIGIQITVPVSVFMPDWALFGRQSWARPAWGSRQFTWVRKPSKPTFLTCPSQRVELEDYLHLLQIDLEPCQELFICQLAADPERFQPLSEILLKKTALKASLFPVTKAQWNHLYSAQSAEPRDGHIQDEEYYLFRAARVGVNSTLSCEIEYRECPVAADSMVNMQMLDLWRFVTKFVDIKFSGEIEVDQTGL